MISADARDQLERLLAARGLDLAALSVADGFAAMLDFYRTVRADDCVITDDGDMLLFQWDRYELGTVAEFRLDLTRQFIRGGGEDDDIWQLSLTFVFPPTALASGQHWCATPADLDAFAAIVRAHPLLQGTPLRVELEFEPAG